MIVWMTDRFRQQAVFGRDFVQRGRHQRFSEKLGTGSDIALHARNDRVEVVECTESDLANSTALRGRRIDIGKVLETFRVFQFAEQRQPVLPGARLCGCLIGKRCCAYCSHRGRSERKGRSA